MEIKILTPKIILISVLIKILMPNKKTDIMEGDSSFSIKEWKNRKEQIKIIRLRTNE